MGLVEGESVKALHVVAAVIRGTDRRILLAQRPAHKHQGGLWEFPGGKVEPGEAVEAALARELHEELDIRVEQARPLIEVRHAYPDLSVLLDVWEVSRFSGTPRGMEGQPLTWAEESALGSFAFPAANRPIVTAACLPADYLITPSDLSASALLAGIERALAQGIRLLQLRAPQLSSSAYRSLADEVLALCAGRARVLLKGPLAWAADFPEAGWHLTAAQLRELGTSVRPLPVGRWLAASCHDAEELALAESLGVDFVTLSPIQPTQTHPEATPLGWVQAAELMRGVNRPVYLLGGLGPAERERAWQQGAQGIAGIRGLWP